jgi:diacylglycerol kinase (ATP)
MTIAEKNPGTGQFDQMRSLILNNYMSIGLDAKVAIEFHSHRNANPHLYTGQNVNKMWYLKFGLEGITSGCPTLPREVQMWVDDKEFKIPDNLENVVVVNLPSMYGGKFMWLSNSQVKPPFKPLSVNDGLLEVVGITGAVHAAQVISGIGNPNILAQGRKIKFRFQNPWPLQIDGEPWLQQPAEVTISFFKPSTLLASESAHENLRVTPTSSK